MIWSTTKSQEGFSIASSIEVGEGYDFSLRFHGIVLIINLQTVSGVDIIYIP